MTRAERRSQLLQVGRRLFAERGLDGTSMEEVANAAGVSKPVVYEHFGGKEGLYAVVVDREMGALLQRIRTALSEGPPRRLLEQAALALLGYIEEESDGFRILIRDSAGTGAAGSYASLLSDVVGQVEPILGEWFALRDYDPTLAGLYAQALVGLVAVTGQWWLDAREPPREQVAAHLVNLAYNGLRGLEHDPSLGAPPSSDSPRA